MSFFDELPDELKSAALAGLDEQTFGASGHVDGADQKALFQKNPKSATAGRVLSYLPLLMTGEPEARAGARLLEEGAGASRTLFNKVMANMPQNYLNKASMDGVNAALKKVPAIPGIMKSPLMDRRGAGFLKQLLQSSLGGAGAATVAGTGNALARKAVDSASPWQGAMQEKSLPEVASDIPYLAAGGSIAGPVGRVAENIAPDVYNHPALINTNNLEKSKARAQDMMDRGIWGTMGGTFKPYAEELQGVVGKVRDKIMPNVIAREKREAQRAADLVSGFPFGTEPATPPRGTVNADADLGQGFKKSRDMPGASDGELSELKNSFDNELGSIPRDQYGASSLEDADARLKKINTEIKQTTTPTQKGRIWGDLDGSQAAKLRRQLALKDSYETTLRGGIDEFGNGGDIAKMRQAKGLNVEGQELEDSMRDYEKGELSDNPHIGHGQHGLTRAVMNKTIGALPVRTGLGTILNMLSPEAAGDIAGRAIDNRERVKDSQPKPMTAEEAEKHFSEMNTPDQQTDESAPAEENPYLKKSAGRMQPTGNPYLDMDMPGQ